MNIYQICIMIYVMMFHMSEADDEEKLLIIRLQNGDVFSSTNKACLNCTSKLAQCVEEKSPGCCKGCQCKGSRTIVFSDIANRYGLCYARSNFDGQWQCHYSLSINGNSNPSIPTIQKGVERIGTLMLQNSQEKASYVNFVHHLFESKWIPYNEIDFYIKQETGNNVLYMNTSQDFRKYTGNVIMVGISSASKSNCILLKAQGNKVYKIEDGNIVIPTIASTNNKITTQTKNSTNSSIVETSANISIDEIYIIILSVSGLFIVLFLIITVVCIRKRGCSRTYQCCKRKRKLQKNSLAALIVSQRKLKKVSSAGSTNTVLANTNAEVYTQLDAEQSSNIEIYHNLERKKKQSATSDYIAPDISKMKNSKAIVNNPNTRCFSDASVAYARKPPMRKNKYEINKLSEEKEKSNNDIEYSLAYIKFNEKPHYQNPNTNKIENHYMPAANQINKTFSLPLYREVEEEGYEKTNSNEQKVNESFYSPLEASQQYQNQYKQLNSGKPDINVQYKELNIKELNKTEYEKLQTKELALYKELEKEENYANSREENTSVYEAF